MKERLKDKMSIKKRLITIELISILGMIAIGLVAIVTSGSINQASTDIAKYWAPAVIAAEELNTHTSGPITGLPSTTMHCRNRRTT